jgi:hypothetical protein
VEAVRIREIRKLSSGALLVPDEEGINYVSVSQRYMEKHKPVVGGYYVRYPTDGYESFSPFEPFDKGYRRLDPDSSDRGMTFDEIPGDRPASQFLTSTETEQANADRRSARLKSATASAIAWAHCSKVGHLLTPERVLPNPHGQNVVHEPFCIHCGLKMSEIRSGVMEDGKSG